MTNKKLIETICAERGIVPKDLESYDMAFIERCIQVARGDGTEKPDLEERREVKTSLKDSVKLVFTKGSSLILSRKTLSDQDREALVHVWGTDRAEVITQPKRDGLFKVKIVGRDDLSPIPTSTWMWESALPDQDSIS